MSPRTEHALDVACTPVANALVSAAWFVLNRRDAHRTR